MTILVIVEHDNASIKAATLNAVAAAQALNVVGGGDVHVLVAGHDAQAAATQQRRSRGVEGAAGRCAAAGRRSGRERRSDGDDRRERLLAHRCAGNGLWQNIAPRIAAKLDVAQISEITAVVSADTFERPICAGNAIATVQSGDPVKVITVRATAFDPVAAEGGSATVEDRSGGRCRQVAVREP